MVSAKLSFGSVVYESKEFALKPGPVKLAVKCEKTSFTFQYAQENNPFTKVQKVDSKFLSSETIGGFTGLYVGLYATGNGQVSTAHVDFDWFEYLPDNTPKKEVSGFPEL